jgi:DNA-directed RNA polymerase I and III subunit RPAC1
MSSEEEEQQQKEEGFSYWNLKDVERGQLPPHIRKQGTRVYCKPDAPTNVFLTHPFYPFF